MRRVLILCTGNSCRSQMAEYLWKALGKGEWEAVSAGSDPAGFVHPLAVAAMAESGADLASARSKSLAPFQEERFDLVVTVCDNARNACPTFPQAAKQLHWPFDDPAEATGTNDERIKVFRKVRDQIADRIGDYLRQCEQAPECKA